MTVSKSLAQTRVKGVFIKNRQRVATFARLTLPPPRLKHSTPTVLSKPKNRRMFGNDYRADLDLIFATADGDYLRPDSVTAKV
jgi:hypothetical protein